MRFGKRSKNPLLWGWRNKTGSETTEDASPEDDERVGPDDEVQAPEGEEEMEMASAPPPADYSAGDPTQRLLTALGRFQRQIARARDGVPQDAWSDECMTQLINAVEIALSQEWNDVVKTLTETARVLQSYENAGEAQQCTGFLNDSYEILCLMVGDLIVGNVRSGVIDKWRKRYDLALDEMEEAGVPLVADDGGEGPEPDEIAAPTEMPSASELTVVEETPAEEVAVTDGIETPFGGVPPEPRDSDVEVPQLDSFFENKTTEDGEDEEPKSEPLDETRVEDETEKLDRAVEELLDELAGGEYDVPTESRGEEDAASSAAEDGPTDSLGVTGRTDLPPDIVTVLDTLCEELAQLADDDDSNDVASVVTKIEESLALLEQHAVDKGRDGAVLPCLAMGRMVRLVAAREAMPDDQFFELAYAFCGLYAEADRVSAPAIQKWLAECDDLLVGWAAQARQGQDLRQPKVDEDCSLSPSETENEADRSAVESEHEPLEPMPDLQPVEDQSEWHDATAEEEAVASEEVDTPQTSDAVYQEPPGVDEILDALEPREEAPVSPQEVVEAAQQAIEQARTPQERRTAENLLGTALRAFSDGNVANAKLFAMQAAAQIAEAQMRQAERQVEGAEAQLKKGVEDSDRARELVRQAEASVAEIEQQVSDTEQHLSEAQGQQEEVQRELEHTESLISEIDEQIRALQQQREDVVRRHDETKARVAQSESQEEELRQHVEETHQAELDARVTLENARQQVKALDRKRAENEAAMERAREGLEWQRASYADIERTIAQICSVDPGQGEDEDELLF